MNSPDQNLTKLQIYVIEELKEYIDKDHLKDKLTAQGACPVLYSQKGRKGIGGKDVGPFHPGVGQHSFRAISSGCSSLWPGSHCELTGDVLPTISGRCHKWGSGGPGVVQACLWCAWVGWVGWLGSLGWLGCLASLA